MRADFVHFGDVTVIDPGQRVGVAHHRGSKRSLREAITQSLGWAVRDLKTSGALVVRGAGRAQASGNHDVGQSRRRMFAFDGLSDYGMVRYQRVAFNAAGTRPFMAPWAGVVETG